MQETLYDAIIIGAGMGGLSTACFLAKAGKRVLVLEKHDKPGGLATSFYRKGLRFDIGIEGLHELKEGDIIHQFLSYWGKSLPVEKRHEKMRVYMGNRVFEFKGESLKEDMLSAFAHEKKAIERFFAINERMLKQMYSGGAPKPPYEMGVAEKLLFGIRSVIKSPHL